MSSMPFVVIIFHYQFYIIFLAPCERLVRSSQCVVDARLRRGKKPTDLVVQPGHQLGVFIPDTLENRGIQAGDAVSILPYAGPYPMLVLSEMKKSVLVHCSGAD